MTKFRSKLLPRPATVSKQHSTLSKGRNFTVNSFVIVAVFGNKVEHCYDIVVGVDGALDLSPYTCTGDFPTVCHSIQDFLGLRGLLFPFLGHHIGACRRIRQSYIWCTCPAPQPCLPENYFHCFHSFLRLISSLLILSLHVTPSILRCH